MLGKSWGAATPTPPPLPAQPPLIIESLKTMRTLPPDEPSRNRIQTTTFIRMKKYHRHVLEMAQRRRSYLWQLSFKNNTTLVQGKTFVSFSEEMLPGRFLNGSSNLVKIVFI